MRRRGHGTDRRGRAAGLENAFVKPPPPPTTSSVMPTAPIAFSPIFSASPREKRKAMPAKMTDRPKPASDSR